MITYVYETIPSKSDEKPEFFEIKQNETDASLTSPPQTGRPIRRVELKGYGALGSKAEVPKDSKSKSSCGCGTKGCC